MLCDFTQLKYRDLTVYGTDGEKEPGEKGSAEFSGSPLRFCAGCTLELRKSSEAFKDTLEFVVLSLKIRE